MGHHPSITPPPRSSLPTRPRAAALSIVVAIAAGVATPSPAAASEALATRHACLACHHADKRQVGPSLKEIAERYQSIGLSAETLATAIKKGGAGKWGMISMPPQRHVPDQDLLTLSGWILAGGRRESPSAAPPAR